MTNQVKQSKNLWASKGTKYIVKVGILSAIAFAMMLFEFPLVFLFPEYLKIDFSDVVAVIGGIAVGPFGAILIIILKNILKAIIFSFTGGIGEIVLITVGLSYVLPIVLFYRKMRNKKGLIIGMLVSIIAMTIAAAITNYFISLPLYFGDISAQERLDMIKVIFTPFNIFKGTVVSIVLYIIITKAPILLKIVKK